MTEPDRFRFHAPVGVRFQDIDALGHAHHSKALVYFEEARWGYWSEVVGSSSIEAVHYVVAEFTVQYHRRVLYPLTLDVGVRVSHVGDKHFVMLYEARSPKGELLLSARSVQVIYDYAAGKSKAIPEVVRLALEARDGPFGASTKSDDPTM